VDGVLARLAAGERVAVVTDAGMPGISDPGERLVAAAVGAGHPVEVVPGPAAAITALVVSGLPAGRFTFEGFLPRKGSGRTHRLAEVSSEARTSVLYEAPHRLARTLADLADACGSDRAVVVGRELTKLHEEVWRGTLGQAVKWVAEQEPRGEMVIVLAGAAPAAPPSEADVDAAVGERLAAGDSARDAAATVAVQLGVPKRLAYEAAIRLAPSRRP
jgi:16S rRNA (cytidine1402-2'-O)-methyltransferase